MCTRAGARSVAGMSRRLIPLAAAAAMAAGPSPAQAAGWMYGGTTRDGEPIAVTAGKGAKKLTAMVISWSATCDGGGRYMRGSALTPMVPQPGFAAGPHDLVMTRNAKARFRGTHAYGEDLGGGMLGAVIVTVDGRLGRSRASGTLSATVKVADASGNAVDSCQTGTVRWSASRAPGKVFAGATSQENPVVIRVDARRRSVSDVLLAWDSSTCTPDASYRYPEHFGNFRLSRAGAFGDPFTQDYPMDDGSKRTFAYRVSGRVTKTAARGTFHATMTDVDPAGAQTLSCDSGNVSWKAVTG
jgi:hypothetical protein